MVAGVALTDVWKNVDGALDWVMIFVADTPSWDSVAVTVHCPGVVDEV
jgi:hypothetical protein